MLKPSEMLEYLMLKQMQTEQPLYWNKRELNQIGWRVAHLEAQYITSLPPANETTLDSSSPTAGPSTTSDLSN